MQKKKKKNERVKVNSEKACVKKKEGKFAYIPLQPKKIPIHCEAHPFLYKIFRYRKNFEYWNIYA